MANCFVGLAVRVVLRIGLHQPGIHGSGFGDTVHRERNVAVLLLFLAAHLLIMFKFALYELHDATQCACLWQIKVLCLSSLHFRYFVLYATGFFGKDGIGHSRPYTHQLGQVHISGKAVVLLELSACGELQHLLNVTEVAYKVIKVINTVLFHRIGRHEIAHERPNLCGSVADWRTCGEDYVSSVVLFQNSLCLQEHAL